MPNGCELSSPPSRTGVGKLTAMPVSARPDEDSDSPNVPIAAEDVSTRLNIQVVAGDLALAAARVGNVNSIIGGTDIDNGYLAERVCQ
jgi:hypothetical protein